jgi:hypothetical protein
MYVTVPQEYKSDKEKKKGKKSNLLLYNKSSFKKSRKILKLMRKVRRINEKNYEIIEKKYNN